MFGSKKSILTIFTILVLSGFSKSEEQDCLPQQIRLSFGDLYHDLKTSNLRLSSDKSNYNQGYLVWLTKSKNVCEFTLSIKDESENSLKTIDKTVTFHENYFYNFKNQLDDEDPDSYNAISYTVLLDNLKYDQSYHYNIIESKSQKSHGPFKFVLSSPDHTTNSKKILILGGIGNDEKGNSTIKKLISEVSTDNNYGALLHLGSLSQNIHDLDGKSGDIFYKSIQEITSKIPYMITPGSHDNFDDWKLLNFRTKNPLFNKTHNHYFSFNFQGIHFVSISFDYYFNSNQTAKTEMRSWIEKDLEAANDYKHRSQSPWIVVVSDSPLYCLNNENIVEDEKCYNYYGQKKDWEDLFHEYSVDLMISNHYSSYERMAPIYQNQSVAFTQSPEDPKKLNIIDPKVTVFLIEGAGGDKTSQETEYIDSSKLYGYVVDKNSGYGVLSTTKSDSGELKLVFEHYNSIADKVIDTMHIIKTNAAGNHRNRAPYFLFVILMVIGVVLITIGLLVLRRRKRAEESEDNIPLTSSTSPMRSNRLRYTRPGEKGIKMVDLVSC